MSSSFQIVFKLIVLLRRIYLHTLRREELPYNSNNIVKEIRGSKGGCSQTKQNVTFDGNMDYVMFGSFFMGRRQKLLA